MILFYNLNKILFKAVVFILLLSFLTALCFDILAQAGLDKRELDFETKLGDVTLLSSDSMTIKDKKPTFDRQKATKKRIAKQSIDLAQQLTEFSRELVENNMQADVNKYPEVKKFFAEAESVSKKGGIIPDINKNSIPKRLLEVKTQAATSGTVTRRLICGTYSNPKPSIDAPRNSFNVGKNNREKTMISWGYHRPLPGLGRLGWTRPKTWRWADCGFNTFRDNAWTDERTPELIYEQNYTGWSPNGEPNPEVYASGPWPYSDWPAYVYWWHEYRK